MQRSRTIIACVISVIFAQPAFAADVILNEYNAVSGSKQLDDGGGADSFFGTIDGNGGNWFELLVIGDHVDLRGWQLTWEEDEDVNENEKAMGTITLSNDSIWSDLRSGSIVTVIETADGGGEGKNTATDTSYDPLAGDWWINIATLSEQAKGESGLTSATTNDGDAGEFSVGKDDWHITIKNAAGSTVFGPVGEGMSWAGGNVNREEGGSLEGPVATEGQPLTLDTWKAVTPSSDDYDDTGSTSFGAPNVDYDTADKVFTTIQDLSALRSQVVVGTGVAGDFNGDELLTVEDIDSLSAAVRAGSTDTRFDVNNDGNVTSADRAVWVNELKKTFLGDSNLDGEFNSSDFVVVLTASEYEDDTVGNSTWGTGDWDGDGDFTTSDFVAALIAEGYETGPRPAQAAAVPEPAGLLTGVVGLLGCLLYRRRVSR